MNAHDINLTSHECKRHEFNQPWMPTTWLYPATNVHDMTWTSHKCRRHDFNQSWMHTIWLQAKMNAHDITITNIHDVAITDDEYTPYHQLWMHATCLQPVMNVHNVILTNHECTWYYWQCSTYWNHCEQHSMYGIVLPSRNVHALSCLTHTIYRISQYWLYFAFLTTTGGFISIINQDL